MADNGERQLQFPVERIQRYMREDLDQSIEPGNDDFQDTKINQMFVITFLLIY